MIVLEVFIKMLIWTGTKTYNSLPRAVVYNKYDYVKNGYSSDILNVFLVGFFIYYQNMEYPQYDHMHVTFITHSLSHPNITTF